MDITDWRNSTYTLKLATRGQIESNDPELDKLTISHYDYLPLDGDLARDGKGIGKHTHIKELCFGDNLAQNNVSRDRILAFCGGLACNKSIKRLRIECSALFGGDIFNMLTPFFEQNSNLRCLSVCGFENEKSPNSVRFLSESLFRYNTLREFDCTNCDLKDSNITTLIQALAGHCGLTKIDLTGNEVGVRALAALSALLGDQNSSLTDLILAQCSLDDEGAGILAPVVGSNGTLKNLLNLGCNGDITITGWRAIFTQLQSQCVSLEDLRLRGNAIDDTAANLLATVLANSAHMKFLDLGQIHGISTEGWQALFTALQSPRCVIKELDLNDNDFNDDDVTYLANSLVFKGALVYLNLSTNPGVSALGWSAFAAILQNPHSALEKLDLGGNSIDDDVLVSFANSLIGNNKLKELFIDELEEEEIAITNWDALLNVLCNKSSIDTTFNSNHTLQRVFDPEYKDESDLPSGLQALLELNRENTEMEAARRKIINAHFSGDFSMQPFIDMDLKTLPHAVAWMARNEYGSSLLYTFVRNTTLFVGLGGGGTKSENEPKSKRQKV